MVLDEVILAVTLVVNMICGNSDAQRDWMSSFTIKNESCSMYI